MRTLLDSWLARPVSPINIQSIFPTGCTLGSDIGNVRSENQDRIVVAHYSSNIQANSFFLFALCDGIGGLSDGRECAQLALAELISSFIVDRINNRGLKEALDLAIKAANKKVYGQYHGQGGTTLSVVALDTHSIIGANVGDSRIYQYQPHFLKQISVDDTLNGQFHLKNEFSSSLLQYIGMGKDLSINFIELSMEMGFLLTSDGIHSIVDHSIMEGLLTHAYYPSEALNRLIELARWLGGNDNASLLYIPNKAIDGLRQLLAKPAMESFLEVWDCFGHTHILLNS